MKKVLDSCNVIHLIALSVLANFIGRATYAPKMAKDDTGKDYPVPGFSHAVALKLSNELSQSARQRGLGIDKIKQIENRLIDWDDVINSLSPWTEAIVNSAEDAYNWEVAAPNDLMPDRAKRRVKKQFFEDGWIDQFIGEQHGNPDPGSGNIHPPPILGCNVPPSITTGGIPILLTYFLHINGQQYGPYPIQQLRDWINGGQVLPSTMAWRDGMLQWQALNTLPEFAVSPPVLGPPHYPSPDGDNKHDGQYFSSIRELHKNRRDSVVLENYPNWPGLAPLFRFIRSSCW